ncbi:hypothetical protein WA026_001962 [Henosepilachna vigintioctopunctata]|uniref:PHD-type domain-containing protein n=1 Tax=Henosepilachna vigintioctopunctata TaxID=420089 RepID=A0AAW1UTB4_9CUCU
MSVDVDVCKHCSDNFIVNSKLITCFKCEFKFHPICVAVKYAWLKIISDNNNIIRFCDGCKLYNSTGNPNVEETVLKKEIECLQRESTLSRKLLEGLEYTNLLQKKVIQNLEVELGIAMPTPLAIGMDSSIKQISDKQHSDKIQSRSHVVASPTDVTSNPEKRSLRSEKLVQSKSNTIMNSVNINKDKKMKTKPIFDIMVIGIW